MLEQESILRKFYSARGVDVLVALKVLFMLSTTSYLVHKLP